MADEPRRSVRATKGQHTKTSDLLDQSSPTPTTGKKKITKKSSKKAAKKDDDEEVEIIRCVCGAIETSDEDTEPWIACDECECWQHNICVGISRFGDEAPEHYLCEKHDPSFPLHKELLDGLKKGRKVWEERRRKVEQEIADEEAEKAGHKKKSKKPQAKRASDLSEISHATNGKAKSPSVPVSEKKGSVARSGSTKRKIRDESHDTETKEPQAKIRRVSEPRQKSPPSDLPARIIDLETSRQSSASLILKNLKLTIPAAIQAGLYYLGDNDTIEAKAERLAIEIENAVFITHPKASYVKQARSVAFNIKVNQELCNGLLTRTLTPSALAVMSSDDMASKQLKAETAEMKARADKQSIMITDNDGPRVRRTHKGDEIVEDDNFAVPDDRMSTARRRSMLDPNAEMASRSRENSPGGDEVELPENIDDHRSHDDIRSHVVPRQPLTVETKQSHPPTRKASGQSSFDINRDINRVVKSVQSPVGTQHIRRPSVNNNAPPVNGPGVDPEIDKLLQDDDGNESPPYSPAEYNSDPEIVWRGTVIMDSIAKFPAVAKHIGGADLSSKTPWDDILQKDLRVAGRIDQEKANEYLCSLRYSQPTDIVIVAVTPTGETASQGYQDLFNYFHSKNRYGVLTNKGIGNIRDTYLVPVPASPGSLPDFVINLEGHKIPEERPEPMILVTLVIRSDVQPETQHNFEAQSPSIMGHPQRQMSLSGAAPAMSPIAPQGSFGSPSTQLNNNTDYRQHEEQRLEKQREGEVNAVRILGQHINAPTVAFLMPQAYQMREVEWEIISDILEKDEKARVDLTHLSQVLDSRMTEQGQRG
ncbi:Transcription factor [Lachnellula subtilissima]|uniref:Transcription factor BYE1 n=1 Tax=Lachnellula subtilissima TaxID=602034 RepID=A0A8H8RDI2_9HELO|nr:Transcription factor [Lachnellula subtilissima]